MARLNVDQAYPGISIRPRSRSLWARLMRWPAECVHLENGHHWMATFIPDTLYLRGKGQVMPPPPPRAGSFGLLGLPGCPAGAGVGGLPQPRRWR